MRVYLAGPYRSREALRVCGEQLTAIGYQVTARWLCGDHDGAPDAATDEPLADRQRWAREDCQDIEAADVVVVFTANAAWQLTYPNSNGRLAAIGFGASGGRHVETGYALANGATVLLVGEPENVFHWLPGITRCEDWHQAVIWLAAHLVEHERSAPRITVGGAR
jgi:hypothetical protein